MSSHPNQRSNRHDPIIRNQRGQGLIEYLIIVALMGVATIAIIRTMGNVVSSKFAAISYQLQGEATAPKARIDKRSHQKRDMGDFFKGAASAGEKSDGGGDRE